MFTILCPTDFSEVASNAVLYASEIAKRLQGRLHLTHILHPTYVAVDANGLFLADVGLEELKDRANARLDQLAKELSNNDIAVTVSTEYGFWDSVLDELEDRVKPDLLVSGTKGSGSLFSAKLLGMNTLDMINKIHCPVLVVPPNYKFSKLENIVYATDYQFEDIDHAAFVVKLAQLNGAQLSFVHVSTNEKKAASDNELMDWFQEMVEDEIGYPRTDFSIITDTDTGEALEAYATGRNVDLVCLAMRQKSALAQFFSYSTSYKLVVDAVVPVLVFHLHENFKL